MVSIRKEHDNSTKRLVLVVAKRRTQVLSETIKAHRPEDNLVATRKNIRILNIGADCVAAAEELSALIEERMSLLLP